MTQRAKFGNAAFLWENRTDTQNNLALALEKPTLARQSAHLCSVGTGRCFKAGANATRDETFTIIFPNVTGVLHMGHAFNNTLQDILIR